MKKRFVGFWFLVAGIAVVIGEEAPSFRPFSNKVIFSETPEIGKKWHGGIRMNDLVIWDGYWNINGWMTVDLLKAGVSDFTINDTTGAKLTDNFIVFSLKSLPYQTKFGGGSYSLGGGIKFYRANFTYSEKASEDFISNDHSTFLFLTQGYHWREKHNFNLFTSLSSRKYESSTYYFIPAYQYKISQRWSFGLEYYMTNTLRLPIRIFQYVFDADHLDFLNSNRDMYSFMIWGVQYSMRHFRLDLTLANHISFQYLVVPMVGVGWDF